MEDITYEEQLALSYLVNGYDATETALKMQHDLDQPITVEQLFLWQEYAKIKLKEYFKHDQSEYYTTESQRKNGKSLYLHEILSERGNDFLLKHACYRGAVKSALRAAVFALNYRDVRNKWIRAGYAPYVQHKKKVHDQVLAASGL